MEKFIFGIFENIPKFSSVSNTNFLFIKWHYWHTQPYHPLFTASLSSPAEFSGRALNVLTNWLPSNSIKSESNSFAITFSFLSPSKINLRNWLWHDEFSKSREAFLRIVDSHFTTSPVHLFHSLVRLVCNNAYYVLCWLFSFLFSSARDPKYLSTWLACQSNVYFFKMRFILGLSVLFLLLAGLSKEL